MTVVEVLVSIFILAAVITPISRLILESASASNQQRLATEAVGVADQLVESIQNKVQFESLPTLVGNPKHVHNISVTSNTTSATQVVDKFQYKLSDSLIFEGGNSICASASGSSPPQIYQLTVSVGWGGNYPVQQSTYIAPEGAGVVLQNTGELAVPVDGSSGAPFVSSSVPVTVTGTWAGVGNAPAVPAGEVTTATVYTDQTGCAAFTDLDPATGWSYGYQLGSGSGVVTYQDYPGTVNGADETLEMPALTAPGLVVGEPVVASPLIVDSGTQVAVSFYTVGFSSGATAISPAAVLPVTVQEASLPGSNQTFSFDTGAGGTTVGSVQLYPYVYSVWSGDTPDSNPAYPPGTSPIYTNPVTTGLNLTQAPLPSSVSLPVYPLVLSVTSPPAGVFDATEVSSPNETIALNPFVMNGTTGVSSTGLPLGQYALSFPGQTGITPGYVWVTPSGVYTGSSSGSAPKGTVVAPGTAVKVTL